MSDPTAFPGSAPDDVRTRAATHDNIDEGENASAQTRFIPSSEGSAPGQPQTWTGPLSGASFIAEWSGGYPVLSVQIDAEIPLQLKDAMKDEAALVDHSKLLDLALKIALDDEVEDARIQQNMLGLVHIRDYMRVSHARLAETLETTGKQMDPSTENKIRFRKSERSIAALDRLARRLGGRISGAVDPRLLAGLEAGDPSPHWH